MEKKVVLDMLGRSVVVPSAPKRIVSLVPSQTELLFDLGLRDEVVGITRFCEHPRQWFLSKQRVGGTKQVKMDRLHALQPDLVLANKEENTEEMVAEISDVAPVWVSDVRTLSDACVMIEQIASLVRKVNQGQIIAADVRRNFDALQPTAQPKKVLYVIWKSPWMAVSGDTFIGEMLRKCGWVNVFEHAADRYPIFDLEILRTLQPDLIFLSSEPFPFADKHVAKLVALQPELENKVHCVDGSFFSWYGSRLIKSGEYFQKLLLELSS
ncbi:MAG: helical backbone metal receptor [Schleiferiaceae bacterium]|nr:helical backbone metal receptor [Schleiferiaceae bacterium]